MASLICTGPGQAPLLLPDPLSSADEAPSYRSGPFKEKVEVAHAEVLQGPSPKDSILKARLVFHNGASAVEHVLPESVSGLFFGKLAGPPLAEGAYVVSSLRANPQCTLERQEESGPVVLSCNAWDELKQRLGSRVSADRHRKRMRRSVLIAGAVIGGLALASGGVLYAGWHKRDLSKAKLARENGNFSRLFSQLIEKQGVEVEFWPEFFDSLNPANVIQAGNNVLGRNKFMEVPRDQHGDIRSGSLTHLMRGGGMYGIAAAQTLGALTLYTFLAERSVRNRIQRHNESMIKKNLRKGMRNVCKPASSCVSSSGGLGTSKETIVFLVI
ncbi:transmembrane protein [Cystoisospora suis]|uniref:Transmembrane protein n=1 Tax=Cystoisospora suis TaxID=483139 RepID=A0A2C6JDL1_9APIC|nr:transmembrane protein [Cystoisospora suis]